MLMQALTVADFKGSLPEWPKTAISNYVPINQVESTRILETDPRENRNNGTENDAGKIVHKFDTVRRNSVNKRKAISLKSSKHYANKNSSPDSINLPITSLTNENAVINEKSYFVDPNNAYTVDEVREAPASKQRTLLDDILCQAEHLLERVQSSVLHASKPKENYDTLINGSEADQKSFKEERAIRPSLLSGEEVDYVMRPQSTFSAPIVSDNYLQNVRLHYDETSKGDQLNWLIRGVPEAYEDSIEMDDEMVSKLLQQGGPPPAELVFPSIHFASQRVMARLRNIRAFRITITRLHIHSYRCGIRRGCGYILLYPPAGCVHGPHDSACRRIDLSTVLTANPRASSQRNRQRPMHTARPSGRSWTPQDEKEVISQYFSGAAVTYLTCTWEMQLSDAVVSLWLHSNGLGHGQGTGDQPCLRLELYSSLYPASNNKKFIDPLPVKFGEAYIPLGGLITTESLDAVLTCDLRPNPAVSAILKERFEKPPYDRRLLEAQAKEKQTLRLLDASDSIGLVNIRLTLLEDAAAPTALPPRPAGESKQAPIPPLILPLSGGEDYSSRKASSESKEMSSDDRYRVSEVERDEALTFLPLEARRARGSASRSVSTRTDSAGPASQNPQTLSARVRVVQEQRENEPEAYFSLTLFSVSAVRLREDCVRAWRDAGRGHARLAVCYKVRRSDHASGHMRQEVLTDALELKTAYSDAQILRGYIYPVSVLRNWKSPVLELWLCDDGDQRAVGHGPELATAREGEGGMSTVGGDSSQGEVGDISAGGRVLVGVGAPSMEASWGQPLAVEIVDPVSGLQRALVHCSLYLHHDRHVVDRQMLDGIHRFQEIERSKVPPVLEPFLEEDWDRVREGSSVRSSGHLGVGSPSSNVPSLVSERECAVVGNGCSGVGPDKDSYLANGRQSVESLKSESELSVLSVDSLSGHTHTGYCAREDPPGIGRDGALNSSRVSMEHVPSLGEEQASDGREERWTEIRESQSRGGGELTVRRSLDKDVTVELSLTSTISDCYRSSPTCGAGHGTVAGSALGAFVLYDFLGFDSTLELGLGRGGGGEEVDSGITERRSPFPALGRSCLWWDMHYELLNSRTRHVLPDSALHSAELREGGLTFTIVWSDGEGGFPATQSETSDWSKSPYILGTAHLSGRVLAEVLERKGFGPVVLSVAVSSLDEGREYSSSLPTASTIVNMSMKLEIRPTPVLSVTRQLVDMSLSDKISLPPPHPRPSDKSVATGIPASSPIIASSADRTSVLDQSAEPEIQSVASSVVSDDEQCRRPSLYVAVEDILDSDMPFESGSSILILCSLLRPHDKVSDGSAGWLQGRGCEGQSIVVANIACNDLMGWDSPVKEEGDGDSISSGRRDVGERRRWKVDWEGAKADALIPLHDPQHLGEKEFIDCRGMSLLLQVFRRPLWTKTGAVVLDSLQTGFVNRSVQIGDQHISSALIPLTPLASGFPYVQGWYMLADAVQRSRGYVKVLVKWAADDYPISTGACGESGADERLACSTFEDVYRLLPLPIYSSTEEVRSPLVVPSSVSNGRVPGHVGEVDSAEAVSTGGTERTEVEVSHSAHFRPDSERAFEWSGIPTARGAGDVLESTSRLKTLVESLEKVRLNLEGRGGEGSKYIHLQGHMSTPQVCVESGDKNSQRAFESGNGVDALVSGDSSENGKEYEEHADVENEDEDAESLQQWSISDVSADVVSQPLKKQRGLETFVNDSSYCTHDDDDAFQNTSDSQQPCRLDHDDDDDLDIFFSKPLWDPVRGFATIESCNEVKLAEGKLENDSTCPTSHSPVQESLKHISSKDEPGQYDLRSPESPAHILHYGSDCSRDRILSVSCGNSCTNELELDIAAPPDIVAMTLGSSVPHDEAVEPLSTSYNGHVQLNEPQESSEKSHGAADTNDCLIGTVQLPDAPEPSVYVNRDGGDDISSSASEFISVDDGFRGGGERMTEAEVYAHVAAPEGVAAADHSRNRNVLVGNIDLSESGVEPPVDSNGRQAYVMESEETEVLDMVANKQFAENSGTKLEQRKEVEEGWQIKLPGHTDLHHSRRGIGIQYSVPSKEVVYPRSAGLLHSRAEESSQYIHIVESLTVTNRIVTSSPAPDDSRIVRGNDGFESPNIDASGPASHSKSFDLKRLIDLELSRLSGAGVDSLTPSLSPTPARGLRDTSRRSCNIPLVIPRQEEEVKEKPLVVSSSSIQKELNSFLKVRKQSITVPQKSPSTLYPGRRKKFLDDETERVSSIMLNKFSIAAKSKF